MIDKLIRKAYDFRHARRQAKIVPQIDAARDLVAYVIDHEDELRDLADWAVTGMALRDAIDELLASGDLPSGLADEIATRAIARPSR